MSTALETIFGLVGGLALFLFGMNMMSEGLQKAAGDKMKKILSMLTKNPVVGVLAGALVTAVLQSSSATTVMVIGFVSAGLMTLPQAISVILGANIGTTMTAQLLAFKISDYIWLIVFVGFIIFFVAKKETVKNVGQTIFAFGLLFVGIETMGDVMKPLASSEVFLSMIEKVADIPVLGVCVGALMTLVVQSSSATIAVLQNFASQAAADGTSSILGLAGAIPILLGDNIGTTITALIASVGQSKNAKRTAVAHTVFNITGSILFLILLHPFTEFVTFISPKGVEVEIISRQIANAHTTFNVICTLLWLPFIKYLVKIVKFIVPGEDVVEAEDVSATKYIDRNILAQPVFAIRTLTQEIADMADEALGILHQIGDVLEEDKEGRIATINDIKSNCISIKKRHADTFQYTTELIAEGSLAESQAMYVSDMVIILEDLEHVLNRCEEIDDAYMEMAEKKLKFSSDARKEVVKELQALVLIYEDVLNYLNGKSENPITEIEQIKENLSKSRYKARKNNVKRLEEHKCKKDCGPIFNEILFSFERIAHGCYNLLESDVSQFALEMADEAGDEI